MLALILATVLTRDARGEQNNKEITALVAKAYFDYAISTVEIPRLSCSSHSYVSTGAITVMQCLVFTIVSIVVVQ